MVNDTNPRGAGLSNAYVTNFTIEDSAHKVFWGCFVLHQGPVRSRLLPRRITKAPER